jgi:hypothetical protein
LKDSAHITIENFFVQSAGESGLRSSCYLLYFISAFWLTIA